MEESAARDFDELPCYVGAVTMVVLLALAAESLSGGKPLTAVVLAVIAISCFYVGASLLVTDLEHRDDFPAAR